MTQVNVVPTTSVRQASAIIGILGGTLLFRERFGRIRLFGAVLIAFGVICIWLE